MERTTTPAFFTLAQIWVLPHGTSTRVVIESGHLDAGLPTERLLEVDTAHVDGWNVAPAALRTHVEKA